MPTGNVWTGPDPAIVAEASRLELATAVNALIPLTLTGARILGFPNGPARPGRMARVWNPLDHGLIASVPLPEVMPAGWHTVPLSVPMAAGDLVVVSYDTDGGYSFLNNALTAPVVAPDGAARFPAGPGNARYNPEPGRYPDSYTASSPFYGVDVTYAWTGTPPPPPPPPPGSKPPNSEQVAVALLKRWKEQGVTAAPAATTRPDPSTWSATGFYTVSVVGKANPADSAGYRGPVVSVDAWAYAPSSGRPPLAHAAALAQLIYDAADAGLHLPVTLDVAAGYSKARVDTAWPVSEIRRVTEPDGSSFAHYSVDIGIGWTRLTT